MWVTGYLKILASYLFLLQVVNLQCFCSHSFVSKPHLGNVELALGMPLNRATEYRPVPTERRGKFKQIIKQEC